MDSLGRFIGEVLGGIVRFLAGLLTPLMNMTAEGVASGLHYILSAISNAIIELCSFLIQSPTLFLLLFTFAGVRVMLGDKRGGIRRVEIIGLIYICCYAIYFCFG